MTFLCGFYRQVRCFFNWPFNFPLSAPLRAIQNNTTLQLNQSHLAGAAASVLVLLLSVTATQAQTPAEQFNAELLPLQAVGPRRDYVKTVGITYVDIAANSSQSAIQALLSANPTYTKFWLLGECRLTTGSLVLKVGQEIHGAYGASFNGSKLLGADANRNAQLGTSTQADAGTHWFYDSGNSRYYIGGQTQARVVFPAEPQETEPGYGRAGTNQELFINDQRVRHAEMLSGIATGMWFFDDVANRIYTKDNPSGKKAETSIATYCINSEVDRIKLFNIRVEKFANYAGYGAVRFGGNDCVAQFCEFSLNHGNGIALSGNRGQVLDFRANWNGIMGVSANHTNIAEEPSYIARGNDNLFLRGEIAFNNDAHFKTGWQGGGTKFWAQTNLRVSDCWVHDNRGVGLWTDTNCYKTVFERNLVEDTGVYAVLGGTSLTTEGITVEICYDTIIRNNLVRHVGKPGGWANGGGIVVMGSYNVEIHGNHIEDCGRGIMGGQQYRVDGYNPASDTWNVELARFGNTSTYGQDVDNKWSLKGLFVHDNTAVASVKVGRSADENYYSGVVRDDGDDRIYTTANNRFESNRYYITADMPNPFAWAGGMRTWAAMRAFGHEQTGTMVIGMPPVPTPTPTPTPAKKKSKP